MDSMKELELKKEYPLAIDIFRELYRLHRIWGFLKTDAPLTQSDLVLMSQLALFSQEDINSTRISHLAVTMKQSVPSISQKINNLERLGYVKRKNDKKDKRVTYIVLTKKGITATEEIAGEFLAFYQSAVDKIGQEKATQLLDLLKEFRHELEHFETDV